jgi:formate hydrogenlyase transcriptional activator
MMLFEETRERGIAEQARREAEEFNRRLIASSLDCLKILDLEGHLLWMNDRGMQALEICDVGPFVDTSWIQFWEGEDEKAAQAAVETARNGGTGRFTGYFATTTTKQPRWWDVVVSPICNAEGKPERLLAVSREVTEQKRNEEAQRKAHLRAARSEERWRSVFENSAIGVALTDLNGRFLATNPVFQIMVSYSEEELRALSFIDITHADYRETNRALAAELLDGKRQQFQIEKQYRRKDGKLIWVRNNVSLVPGTETMPRFIMALSEDITERKTVEAALRKSEEQVRLILDSTAEGIFGCDSNGICLFCNPAAVRLLGYDDASELLGKNMHALEHHTRMDGSPYPIEQCPIYVGFRNGEGVHRDDEVYWRKDGTCFPVEFWSHPVFREGRTLGAVIAFVDITERKKAEEVLRNSEQRKQTLLELNNAIITNLTEEALLRSISEAMRPLISSDRCAITVYKQETDTFRFLAVVGALRSDYFQPGLEVGRTETSLGWAFDNQKPLLRRNLADEQPFANEKRLCAEGLRSLCAVPLILRGKSIGTLSLVSRNKDQYSAADAQFLQEVAVQVALAIENMKAFEEIAALKARLEKENLYLREEIRSEHNFEEIVGNSPALRSVLRALEQVAPTDSTVLICGETGTGKELVARAIHDHSARKNRALVSVNCSALSAGLVESELFGHLKGAFTGAIERRIGRFELANGGTIFLDEIGELALETQVKLLRVLQEHEFEPVGSSRPQRVDVRVIAATNRNLSELVEAGRFRSDLFYRLNVLPLQLPPLRERRSDIPQLVALFVPRFAKRFGKKVEGVSQETMARLMSYAWPGNIRELQNVLERAVVLSEGSTLRLDKDLVPLAASEGAPPAAEIPVEAQAATHSPAGLPTLEEMERSHILAALQQANGVIDGPKGAAKILDIHPNTLRHRMSKLRVNRSGHRPS